MKMWLRVLSVVAVYFLILIAGMLLVSQARAENITLTWAESSGSESCTPADPGGPVVGYRIYQMIADVGNVTSHVLTGLVPGDYVYTASAYNDDAESRLTLPVTRTATTFMALAGSTVYEVVTIENAFWLLPVGNVTENVECVLEQSVNGKHAIPVDGVTWSAGVQPKLMVVADCE